MRLAKSFRDILNAVTTVPHWSTYCWSITSPGVDSRDCCVEPRRRLCKGLPGHVRPKHFTRASKSRPQIRSRPAHRIQPAKPGQRRRRGQHGHERTMATVSSRRHGQLLVGHRYEGEDVFNAGFVTRGLRRICLTTLFRGGARSDRTRGQRPAAAQHVASRPAPCHRPRTACDREAIRKIEKEDRERRTPMPTATSPRLIALVLAPGDTPSPDTRTPRSRT